MIEFQISAPASISLFGEHVKYTLRTSIDLRTTLNFQVFPIGLSNNIEISFPEIDLFLTLPLEDFQEFYYTCVHDRNLLNSQISLLTCLIDTDNKKKFLQIFCCLFVHIMYEEQTEIKPFSIIFVTQLIFNEKFISLASLKVCVAACLLHWSRLQKGIQCNFDDTDLDKICTYAMCYKDTEKTSKLDIIDIIACTYGTIIRYEKESNKFTSLYLSKMTILLVDSKQSQDVEARNQRVIKLMKEFPKLASFIFNNIGDVTNMAADTFQEIFKIYKDNKLSIEMKNDCLLQQQKALEVSHNMNSTKKCCSVVCLCVAAFSVSYFFMSFI